MVVMLWWETIEFIFDSDGTPGDAANGLETINTIRNITGDQN